MTWSFHENKRSVLIMGDQGEPIARVQCVEGNHEDDVRRAKEICQANKTIMELKSRVSELEMENARLNIEIAGLKITANGIDFYVVKNGNLKARIAKLEDVLKRANDIAELWVCEGSWGEDERELLDILALNQWREE